MKIFSRKEKFSPEAFSGLTEQDKINFLGAMCMCCDPVVVKGSLIEFVRSEYVPQNKDDIELARQLFASSGIDLKVRYVNVSRYAKMPMLRSRLFYTSRNSVLNKTCVFMHRVEDAIQDLAKTENNGKWYELQKKLDFIRSNFYQNVQ